MEIKVGDLVSLRNHLTVKMVVRSIDNGFVTCNWLDSRNQSQQETYSVEQMILRLRD